MSKTFRTGAESVLTQARQADYAIQAHQYCEHGCSIGDPMALELLTHLHRSASASSARMSTTSISAALYAVKDVLPDFREHSWQCICRKMYLISMAHASTRRELLITVGSRTGRDYGCCGRVRQLAFGTARGELPGDRTGGRLGDLHEGRVETLTRLDTHGEHVEGVGETESAPPRFCPAFMSSRSGRRKPRAAPMPATR